MLHLKNIELLVVHCSDTANNQNLSAIDIHQMHLSFGWDGIGYHKTIKRSGKIEMEDLNTGLGLMLKENDISLSVCLIGRDNFTKINLSPLNVS